MVRNKSNNPFKVSQVRSVKCKNKAKAYVTKLKKLNEITKQKVEDLDKQMKTLDETLHEPSKAVKTPAPAPNEGSANSAGSSKKKSLEECIKEFTQTENNAKEALDKLDNIEIL